MVPNGNNGTIGANDDPFETMMIHWSYNGANGDGVLHWRHYFHPHWSQWIAIGTIFCRHWRQWCQWREPQIVMTLLPANRAKIDKSNFQLQKTLPSLDFATVDGQKI